MTSKLKFIFDPAFLLVLVIGAGSCLFRLGMADLDIDESFTALTTGRNFGQIQRTPTIINYRCLSEL